MDEEDTLDSLLRLTAGSDARRTLSIDSIRYTFNRYAPVEDSKRGTLHQKDTVKHHALITADLKIVTVVLTNENAGDVPILTELCAKVPHGEGYLLGDSAYCTRKNCRLANDLGRSPCFQPKKRLRGSQHVCTPESSSAPGLAGPYCKWRVLPWVTACASAALETLGGGSGIVLSVAI